MLTVWCVYDVYGACGGVVVWQQQARYGLPLPSPRGLACQPSIMYGGHQIIVQFGGVYDNTEDGVTTVVAGSGNLFYSGNACARFAFIPSSSTN